MSGEVVVIAEQTPCTGTHDQLFQTFRAKRITAVQVGNLPQHVTTKEWFRKCYKVTGMVEVQKYACISWHEFKTPDLACKYMINTNGKTFKGNKLTAHGIHQEGRTLQEILAKTREQIEAQGILLRQTNTDAVILRPTYN